VQPICSHGPQPCERFLSARRSVHRVAACWMRPTARQQACPVAWPACLRPAACHLRDRSDAGRPMNRTVECASRWNKTSSCRPVSPNPKHFPPSTPLSVPPDGGSRRNQSAAAGIRRRRRAHHGGGSAVLPPTFPFFLFPTSTETNRGADVRRPSGPTAEMSDGASLVLLPVCAFTRGCAHRRQDDQRWCPILCRRHELPVVVLFSPCQMCSFVSALAVHPR
jgi:hypothetical protein